MAISLERSPPRQLPDLAYLSLAMPLDLSICVPQKKDFTTLAKDLLGFVHLFPSATFETMRQKNNLFSSVDCFLCHGTHECHSLMKLGKHLKHLSFFATNFILNFLFFQILLFMLVA